MFPIDPVLAVHCWLTKDNKIKGFLCPLWKFQDRQRKYNFLSTSRTSLCLRCHCLSCYNFLNRYFTQRCCYCGISQFGRLKINVLLGLSENFVRDKEMKSRWRLFDHNNATWHWLGPPSLSSETSSPKRKFFETHRV